MSESIASRYPGFTPDRVVGRRIAGAELPAERGGRRRRLQPGRDPARGVGDFSPPRRRRCTRRRTWSAAESPAPKFGLFQPFSRVLLFERLREVRAMTGFRRVSPSATLVPVDLGRSFAFGTTLVSAPWRCSARASSCSSTTTSCRSGSGSSSDRSRTKSGHSRSCEQSPAQRELLVPAAGLGTLSRGAHVRASADASAGVRVRLRRLGARGSGSGQTASRAWPACSSTPPTATQRARWEGWSGRAGTTC